MQARKRAKPVKFGKAALKEEKKEESPSTAHETAAHTHASHSEHAHHDEQEVRHTTHHETHEDVVEKAAEDVKEAVRQEPEPVEESVEVTVEKKEEDHSREDKELAALVHAAAIRKAEAMQVSSDVTSEERKDEDERETRRDYEEKEAVETPSAESVEKDEKREEERREEKKESFEEEKEEPFSSNELAPKRKTKKNNLVLYFVLTTILTFLIGLGLIVGANYFLNSKSAQDPKPAIVLKSTTPTPSPVPTKAVDLSAYNVKVLNGSGVTGAASRVKTSLVTEGFKVTSTANAASSDFAKTKIQAKSTVDKAYLSKLEDFLSQTYVVDSSVDTLTAPSDEADVVVTIGTDTK